MLDLITVLCLTFTLGRHRLVTRVEEEAIAGAAHREREKRGREKRGRVRSRDCVVSRTKHYSHFLKHTRHLAPCAMEIMPSRTTPADTQDMDVGGFY